MDGQRQADNRARKGWQGRRAGGRVGAGRQEICSNFDETIPQTMSGLSGFCTVCSSFWPTRSLA